MHTYASILALIEEREGDVREIEGLLERNRTAWWRRWPLIFLVSGRP